MEKVQRMTTSPVTTRTVPVTDQDKPRSTFDTAVEKIMQETGCTLTQATVGLRFISKMASKARNGRARMCDTVGTHHLTQREMDREGYPIMDQIMGHGARAVSGSAHAAVESHVLRSNEFSLIHDNPTGEKSDCQVKLGIDSLS